MTTSKNTTSSLGIPEGWEDSPSWRPSEWEEVQEYVLYSTFGNPRDVVPAEPGLLAVRPSRDGYALAHEVVAWGVADRYTFPVALSGELGSYLEYSLQSREEGVLVGLVRDAHGLRVAEEGFLPVTYEQAGMDR